MTAVLSEVTDSVLEDAQTEAYAQGRADQLKEDVARLMALDKFAGARHNLYAYAVHVLLEKQ